MENSDLSKTRASTVAVSWVLWGDSEDAGVQKTESRELGSWCIEPIMGVTMVCGSMVSSVGQAYGVGVGL